MSDLILYTNPMSRGRIARWMLEEVGEPYDARILAYGPDGMGRADYRAINPMMKVPCLVHGSSVITETAAICLYLADVFPAAGLGPRADEKADYYRWILFAAGPLEQAATTKAVGWQVPDDPQKQGMLGFGTVERTMDTLRSLFAGRHYVCGERFTAADVYVGAHVSWGLEFGTIPPAPELQSYAARVTGRDAWQKAKAIDDALMAQS